MDFLVGEMKGKSNIIFFAMECCWVLWCGLFVVANAFFVVVSSFHDRRGLLPLTNQKSEFERGTCVVSLLEVGPQNRERTSRMEVLHLKNRYDKY